MHYDSISAIQWFAVVPLGLLARLTLLPDLQERWDPGFSRGGLMDDRYVTVRQEDMLVAQYDMWMEFHALRDYKGYPGVRCGPRRAIGEHVMTFRLARILGP